MLKKYLTTLLMVTSLSVTIPFLGGSSIDAQTRRYTSTSREYIRRNGVVYKRPNFYRRHRTAINIAAGAGIGALLGGLIGHGRGAAVGALAGAGGGWYYTHKQRPKNYWKPINY